MPKYTQVVKNKKNKVVLELYYASRPQGLDNSVLPAPVAAAAEPGILAGVGKNMVIAGVGAAGGAIGGVSGAAKAVAAVGAANVAFNLFDAIRKLFEAEPGEDLPIEYLNKQTFSNLNIPAADLATLQKMYDAVMRYQEEKKRRFTIPAFNPEVINDPKYLIAILIGRKIANIANVHSKEEMQIHWTYLRNFIKNVTNSSQYFLDTRSVDDHTVSLRSTLMAIELADFENTNQQKNLSHNTQQKLQDIKELLSSIKESSMTICERVKNKYIEIATPYSPDDMKNVHSSEPLIQRNADVQNLKKEPMVGIVQNLLFSDRQLEHAKQTSDEEFKKLLAQAARINEKFILAEHVDALKNLLIARGEVLHLLALMEKIIKFANTYAISGMCQIVEETQRLVNVFSQTMVNLKNREIEFSLAIDEIYHLSHNNHYRNQVALYNQFGQISLDLIPEIPRLCSTLSSLGLEHNLPELVQENLDANAQELKVEIRKAVAIHGNKETVDANEDWHTSMQQVAKTVDETNIKLEASTRVAPGQVAMFVQKKSNNEDDDNEDVLIAEFVDLTANDTKIAKLEEQVGELTAQLAIQTGRNNKQLADATTEVEKAKRALKTNEVKQKIIAAKVLFYKFIDSYSSYTNQFGGCFFHKHGAVGVKRAEQIRSNFDSAIKNFNPDIDKNIEAQMQVFFEIFLTRNQNLLKGNFHPHSLNTYLIGYYNLINSDLSKGDELASVNVNDVIKATVAGTVVTIGNAPRIAIKDVMGRDISFRQQFEGIMQKHYPVPDVSDAVRLYLDDDHSAPNISQAPSSVVENHAEDAAVEYLSSHSM